MNRDLSSRSLPTLSGPALQLHGPAEASRTLPRVEWVERSGAVLHTSPMAEAGDVLSLNLTRGCVHRCGFCSARASANYPGDQTVFAFADTAERLRAELRQRRNLPRAVFLCPSTDPFPPLAEIQAETVRVVEVLASHDVEAWLMTRGFIRPAAVQALTAHREKVRVTIALTTLDRTLQRTLEPLAAPPPL